MRGSKSPHRFGVSPSNISCVPMGATDPRMMSSGDITPKRTPVIRSVGMFMVTEWRRVAPLSW